MREVERVLGLLSTPFRKAALPTLAGIAGARGHHEGQRGACLVDERADGPAWGAVPLPRGGEFTLILEGAFERMPGSLASSGIAGLIC